MKTILKVAHYAKKHLFRDPIYFFLFAVHYFNPRYVPKINYHSIDATRHFLNEGKSIIRFGDGEIFILNGGNLPGQKYDSHLAHLMSECISTYSDISPYVVCLNRTPLEKSNALLRREGLIPCWLPSKVYFNLYFRKEEKYLDAAMFYYGDTIPKYFENYLVTKKIILITNKDNLERFNSNEAIPFRNVSFVETPSRDAFTQYDRIKNEVMDLVEKNGRKDTVILAAFGPSSKALAFEFAGQGIQVIDIGQGIEVAYSDKKLYTNLSSLQ